ncbi:hypothetical protein DL98DRAFT_574728 [Cadophora sp. DSE1049]|nr:hypothetical protein DL98DRAFT_574728 [Cadophora sp. DSE1049]
MEMQSSSPARVVFRFENSPDEDLEVAAAFAQRPDAVRDALLEALRHVQLRSIDITLLRIEDVFRSTLKEKWREPRILRPVLEACRQGKLNSRTESLFFEYGKEYGVVALSVATREDGYKLFREIDALSDDELVKLVNAVETIPKRPAILEFIQEFVQSPESVVSDPPPHLPRPRTRRAGTTASPGYTNPVSSNIIQHNKRRKLGSALENTTQGPSSLGSRLPPIVDITTACRPLPLPLNFPLQPALLNYHSLQRSNHATIPKQPSPGQGQQWALQTTAPSLVPGDPQQSQMTGLEEQWDLEEELFIQGRPGRYDPGLQEDPWALEQSDPQQSQMVSLEQWELTEADFTQGRPCRYEPQPPQVGQEQWLFPGEAFTQGRPDRYDPRSAQASLEGFAVGKE